MSISLTIGLSNPVTPSLVLAAYTIKADHIEHVMARLPVQVGLPAENASPSSYTYTACGNQFTLDLGSLQEQINLSGIVDNSPTDGTISKSQLEYIMKFWWAYGDDGTKLPWLIADNIHGGSGVYFHFKSASMRQDAAQEDRWTYDMSLYVHTDSVSSPPTPPVPTGDYAYYYDTDSTSFSSNGVNNSIPLWGNLNEHNGSYDGKLYIGSETVWNTATVSMSNPYGYAVTWECYGSTGWRACTLQSAPNFSVTTTSITAGTNVSGNWSTTTVNGKLAYWIRGTTSTTSGADNTYAYVTGIT